jgi:hypothetical protein
VGLDEGDGLHDDLAGPVVVIEDVEGVAAIGMGLQGDRGIELGRAGDEGVDRVVDARPIEPGLRNEERLNRAAEPLEVGDGGVLGQRIGADAGVVRESSVRTSIGP